jgi:hypothetical protein
LLVEAELVPKLRKLGKKRIEKRREIKEFQAE